MGDLRKVNDVVLHILESNAAARDSDEVLYTEVLRYYGQRKRVNFDRIAVSSFFMNYKKYGIPSIETVGRCRRKLQEEYEELRATNPVGKRRKNREQQFREYARY